MYTYTLVLTKFFRSSDGVLEQSFEPEKITSLEPLQDLTAYALKKICKTYLYAGNDLELLERNSISAILTSPAYLYYIGQELVLDSNGATHIQ